LAARNTLVPVDSNLSRGPERGGCQSPSTACQIATEIAPPLDADFSLCPRTCAMQQMFRTHSGIAGLMSSRPATALRFGCELRGTA